MIEMLTINDSDDLFLYFAIIKQMKPDSVLDIGMFLKRIGAVCRQVCNSEIPVQIELDAVDYVQEDFPVYHKIYNNIYRNGELPQKKYDMILGLYLSQMIDSKRLKRIWEYALERGKVIVIEATKEAEEYFARRTEVQVISVSLQKKFFLIRGIV